MNKEIYRGCDIWLDEDNGWFWQDYPHAESGPYPDSDAAMSAVDEYKRETSGEIR